MRKAGRLAPVVLLLAGGCLSTKGDIRLLQDELRATRAQLALGDTSLLRADAARRSQISALSSQIDRMNDSLRTLANRVAAFQATANGEFNTLNTQMVSVQALLGQTQRNLQDTRAQIQALREQGISSATPASAPTNPDSARAATGPGPATLFTSATESLQQGSYGTARRSLEQLIAQHPDFDRMPAALLALGEAYKGERNAAAADSVYQLVYGRFPRSDEAGRAMYLHGKALLSANKRAEARVVFNRVVKDYPGSDAAELAKDELRRPE
jgi:TolA-binding protein